MRKHIKDYFIPHEGNDYKPHSLQKIAMTGMVAMVLLSFTLANVQSFLWVASDWMVSTVLPAVIVELTNNERADDSLGQLRRNASLDEAARLKAQHMAEREYFAHFSPTGVSPWFWFAEAQYNFVHAGENLAIHFTDSDEVIDAWMDSPTHRANIMNGNYTEIGVGTAEGEFEGYKTIYVVQMFGAPAAAPAVAGSVISVAQAAEVEATIIDELVSVPIVTSNETDVLAEAVEITEDVVLVEADPAPVAVAVQDEALPDTEKTVETYTVTEFSSFMSTSTGAIPASIDPTELLPTDNSSHFLGILTQPQFILLLAYMTIGTVVFVSLILSVFIEIRKQHPVQIAYSLALLLLMFGLFKIHELLSAGVVVV